MKNWAHEMYELAVEAWNEFYQESINKIEREIETLAQNGKFKYTCELNEDKIKYFKDQGFKVERAIMFGNELNQYCISWDFSEEENGTEE